MGESTIETWKEVLGYEGWYSVSNLGRVRRDMAGKASRVGKILSFHQRSNQGYCTVILSKNNIQKTFTVHKLVTRAFLGECPYDKEVNHKDTIKSNNSILNLEYLTHKANVGHAWENGKHDFRGIKNGRAKLKELDVLRIRSLYLNGGITQTELGKRFKVDNTIVSLIVRRKIWTHV